MPQSTVLTFYSSQTESLLAALLHQLESDLHSPVNTPFGRTTIVVPNSGMQRYLEINIAKAFGICSHVDIVYLGQLLSRSYREVLNSTSSATLDEHLLTFTLLQLWQHAKLPTDPQFNALFKQHQQPRQRYLFAKKIAKLLRQYLQERPEMIDAWQNGQHVTDNQHERWQREILQQVFSTLAMPHTSTLAGQQQFSAALPTVKPSGDSPLQQTIHVFGFHAISPYQLSDLLALSQVTPVRFYTFNPCIDYWLDTVPESLKTQLEITATDEAALMRVGHPLLAAWGRSGKYLIEQLNEHSEYNLDQLVAEKTPTEPTPTSVLTWLQYDIQGLPVDNCALAALHAAEQHNKTPSISLHASANPRREVEVLYDNLCHYFETGQLTPADVLVIVPALSEYAPHIQAIFSCQSAGVNLPFSLANQRASDSEPDAQAFLALLRTIESDFQAQHLFETLGEARIQAALHLDQAHLDQLRYWLLNSRFSVNFYDNSDGSSSSLEKLLDSLLLAHIGGDGTTLGKRQASPHYHSGLQDTLAQLCSLWQHFAPFVSLTHKTLTLSAWHDTLRALADQFLPPRHDMDGWLNDWYAGIAELDDQSVYDFATVYADISGLLENDTLHGPFLSGGVSFCAMMPMRAIPATMIAVLGLNDNFPTISAKDPLDLRLLKPRWSDRNPHKEQQYFFLETLMAARETLYLSHIGLNEKTGETIPPSSLVWDLFTYLEQQLPAFSTTVTATYPLQGFISESSYQTLYTTPPIEPIDAPAHSPTDTQNNSATDVDYPDSLTAKALAQWLCEPLNAYWRYRLGAEPLDQLTEPLASHAFIACNDGLDTWIYKNSALQIAQQGQPETTHQTLQQQNRYAPVAISQALLANAQATIAPLSQRLTNMALDEPTAISDSIRLSLSDSVIYLHTVATRYAAQGFLTYHVGKLNAQKLLHAWISHLIYHANAENPPCQSTLLTTEDKGKIKTIIFGSLAETAATTALTDLLTFAQQILQTPYPVTAQVSTKQTACKVKFVETDCSLYSQIPPANEASIEQINQLWDCHQSVLSDATTVTTA